MDRNLALHMAKLAEQAERFEEMVGFMKEIIGMGLDADDLTQEERNLISVGYKNMISQRRQAIRSLGGFDDGGEHTDLKKQYNATLAQEVDQVINMVINDVVSKFTVGPNAAQKPENLVFFHKMEGDYYRYGAEICGEEAQGDEAARRENYTSKAREAYDKADKAGESLLPTNPIKLGLALNQSVFFYEICKETQGAKDLAKKAFDAAIDELDSLQEQEYKDSTLIMQLLKDNLSLWSENEDDEIQVQDIEQ